ncbi:MFS transporter [Paenibacillus doosanensis]|uniref:MFS transporter n=1 Tax=Paenibacillus doosanensis TaxID=1229154 RepID=UPI00217F5E0A|nr:MFS transporter [Paenibacillus doosanensis]MCS7463912.1 MFS transporter [Paenibacillus doosanensis]
MSRHTTQTAAAAATADEAIQERQADPRRWYALAVFLLPVLLISLNTYMIQVALPSIQSSLQASFSEAQLMVSGFSLSLAVALIVSGKLGDLYGKKRMLLIGVSGFTLMAALGGMASDPALLIALRIVQGIAAACIQPQVLSLMQVGFLPREKGLVFAIYGALIGLGFAFGLILGGILVHWNPFGLGWRTVFYFNVPFGGAVLLLLPFLPEAGMIRRRGRGQSIDWTGTLLLTVGLFLLIYPLSEGQKRGWPLWTGGCLAASVLLLLAFIAVQIRKRGGPSVPLIDLSIFLRRTFRIGILTVITVYFSMFSFFFILSYYLQFGLHYSMQLTSFVFLPLGCGFFLTSLLSSRIVSRWGITGLKAGALVMGGSTFLLIASLHCDSGQLLNARAVLILLVYGCGLGMVTTPLANVVLSTVTPEEAGTGSGLFTTFLYLSNSLGVALTGILFTASLGHPLAEAAANDYVRAFSASLTLTGGLAFAAFGLLCLLPGGEANSQD